MNKNITKKKKGLSNAWTIVISALAGIAVFICLTINFSNFGLDAFIKSFSKVEYTNQLVPTIEQEGYYTFRTDGDFKVMQINDIHIGGGRWTTGKDQQAIYTVMTMVQEEKPDLVILVGDSIFAVPGPIFNGGGTLNNKKASKYVLDMFEQLGVYYSVVFGNHDTEAFDLYNRQAIGELYESNKYPHCIFNSDYDGYGVTNQCILVKNNDGKIRKALMLIDSNDYIDDSISASINWQYDTIHDEQVYWAKDTIEHLSYLNGENVKSLAFFHIPTGEFEVAYEELEANNWQDTPNTKYIEGVWDEEISDELGIRIWYGGCHRQDEDPLALDKFFEVLGPSGINTLEGIFVGHDHTNNAVVTYKGVMLSYNYSIDNTAYDDIQYYGAQRGATVITLHKDKTWEQVHKNAYKDYSVDPHRVYKIDVDTLYYDNAAPAR